MPGQGERTRSRVPATWAVASRQPMALLPPHNPGASSPNLVPVTTPHKLAKTSGPAQTPPGRREMEEHQESELYRGSANHHAANASTERSTVCCQKAGISPLLTHLYCALYYVIKMIYTFHLLNLSCFRTCKLTVIKYAALSPPKDKFQEPFIKIFTVLSHF